MSAKTDIRFRVVEFVNVLFGIFTWIMPDIAFPVKIVLSIILLGINIVLYFKPDLIVHFGLIRLLLLWFLPLVLAVVEFWIVSIIVEPMDFKLIFQLGMTYGISIALPLSVLFGLNSNLGQIAEAVNWKYVYITIGIAGGAGCGLQLLTLPVLAVLQDVFLINQTFNNFIDNALTGIAGPIMLAASSFWKVDNDANLTLILLVLIGALQNAQFAFLGPWIVGNRPNENLRT